MMKDRPYEELYREGMDYSVLTKETVPEPYWSYIEVMGLENFMRMIKRYGGKNIYIPKDGAMEKIVLEHTIRQEYNGRNISKMAKKYDISRKRIYEILKR